jgi:NAD(P)-dependent dehydrogenase (short-subunit alcohol dehydrogenase family)
MTSIQVSQIKRTQNMQRAILVTGATDGIGLETAKMLASLVRDLVLHGHNRVKLEKVVKGLMALTDARSLESYVADLLRMSEVESLAESVIVQHDQLDVLINNAGVFATPDPITKDGMDIRFAVNTIAPYLLIQRLLPLLGKSGCVIISSSAANRLLTWMPWQVVSHCRTEWPMLKVSLR